MKNLFASACTAAVLTLAVGALPAQAATWSNSAQLQNAQFSFSFGTGNSRDRGRDHFQRRGNSYYYNGHRGYRDRRPGFRFYNGFWFPQAAFSFSFGTGNDRGGYHSSSSHVRWCEDRYRSYRASDNTFQPYHGPRQECVSPYSR